MVKFIAHRGNYNGSQPVWENTKDYLEFAYHDKGYDVECDLIGHNGLLYYGHDDPQEPADTNFLQLEGVWCHAKNLEALTLLLMMRTNCFWHENDTVTLTSNKYIWCFPGHYPISNRAVWLDLHGAKLPVNIENIHGICGDHAGVIK